ncbi:MAG: hypothetical protein RLZZ611_1064 [Cyanobacteriota bacterium]|jgi:hypothetical protein
MKIFKPDLYCPKSVKHNKVAMNKLIARQRESGFTNQQAIFVLLLLFPIGLVVLGLVVMLLRRTPDQVVQPPSNNPPAQPAPAPAPPTFTPAPPPQNSGLDEGQARAVVEQWLSVKSQIFAPPYDTNVADRIVAEGPLWTDLTKTNGSIDWLKSNNSYYSYNSTRVNNVIRFTPSATMPTLLVSVTEDSVLHSPKGSDPSVSTSNYLYTLKQENGVWKVWDYRKQ